MTKLKILVPMDGTEFSKAIFPKLNVIARSSETEIILLHVEHVVTQSFGVAPGYLHIDFNSTVQEENMRHAVLAKMVPEAESLEEMGYTVQREVGFGEPADQILFYADLAKVDLIAMATHGREGLSHFIQGSVAESVLHKAKVPVLMVRPEEIPVSE
ncbi:MAG: universal stress protein [Chloroflexota bacterium]